MTPPAPSHLSSRSAGDLIETTTPRESVRAIALIGNHTPRQCGIATFTADLRQALAQQRPSMDTFVAAMNDAGKQYAYPPQVHLQIADTDPAAYHRAADFLNVSDVGVVSLQHEYGIFGGDAGANVLALLRDLRMPIVATLHTILAEPSGAQRKVMGEICALAERLVVMSPSGAALLREVHDVDPSKIDYIPHGIPIAPRSPEAKGKVGVEGRRVLLTFGLLSPDKGVEYVIEALPAIVKRYPDVTYVVLGATHPHVKERQGEAYRLLLEARAHRLGMDDHVVFCDRFVTNAELLQFMSAADVYITPYLNAAQITSGTLAYALGSGKAVISTPYRYAEDLLAEGRGILVPRRDPAAIAAQVIGLFADDGRRAEMEGRAAEYGRSMSWPVVAQSYLQSFEKAVHSHDGRTRSSRTVTRMLRRPAALPEMNLAHLRAMTDGTGLLQHAAFSVPRYEDGYCLDDNARALMLLAMVEDAGVEHPAVIRQMATRYLAFVRHAFVPANGRFRNFLSYSREWVEEVGSEDSHGRAVWSLGTVLGRSSDVGRRGLSAEIFHAALPATVELTSPRAWAYALLGISGYLRSRDGEGAVQAIGRTLGKRLLELFQRNQTEAWPWFEDRLTYSNARLPQALLVTGTWMEQPAMVAAGLQSLEWLFAVQRIASGLFAPIGSNGFYVRGGPKAAFDQQPVEACGMVSACLEAARITEDRVWIARARHAFDWFLGQNELEQWLYDASTGGCRDGLHPERPNENQGAESTLSFLTALMEMREVQRPVDSQTSTRAREIRRIKPGAIQ